MDDGVSGVERVRTRQKAVARMVEMIKMHSPFEKIAFLHSTAIDSMQRLKEEVKQYLPMGDIYMETINPVIGAHIGPGVVGFAGVSSK
jgi:fatty acid-binding protein DegV